MNAEHTRSFVNGADVSAQIAAVGRVHELLQSSSAADEVDIAKLVEGLVEQFRTSTDVRVTVACGPRLILPAKEVTLVGIVANELVTNPVKHADAPRWRGTRCA